MGVQYVRKLSLFVCARVHFLKIRGDLSSDAVERISCHRQSSTSLNSVGRVNTDIYGVALRHLKIIPEWCRCAIWKSAECYDTASRPPVMIETTQHAIRLSTSDTPANFSGFRVSGFFNSTHRQSITGSRPINFTKVLEKPQKPLFLSLYKYSSQHKPQVRILYMAFQIFIFVFFPRITVSTNVTFCCCYLYLF